MRRGFLVFALGFLPVSEGRAQNPNYSLSLNQAEELSGASVEISVFLDFPNGGFIHEISLGVCASPGHGSPVDSSCMEGPPFPTHCLANGIVVPGADLQEASFCPHGGPPRRSIRQLPEVKKSSRIEPTGKDLL